MKDEKDEMRRLDNSTLKTEDVATIRATLAALNAKVEASAEIELEAKKSAVKSEVAAIIAGLKSKDDIRFTRTELPILEKLLVMAKEALFAGSKDAEMLAAAIDADLTTYIAAKAPAAPGGTLPISGDTLPPNTSTDTLTVADFTAAATDNAVAKKIYKVLQARVAKDPKFTMAALRAEVLAREVR